MEWFEYDFLDVCGSDSRYERDFMQEQERRGERELSELGEVLECVDVIRWRIKAAY